MWFIARKTLDNSCACRCYITFGWESKWLRSDGEKKKEQNNFKKNERMKDRKTINRELMYIIKKKKSSFFLICLTTLKFIAYLYLSPRKQCHHTDCFPFGQYLWWNIAQFIISRVWLLSCHMRRERDIDGWFIVFFLHISVIHVHISMRPGPCNSSSFRYITWKKRAHNNNVRECNEHPNALVKLIS